MWFYISLYDKMLWAMLHGYSAKAWVAIQRLLYKCFSVGTRDGGFGIYQERFLNSTSQFLHSGTSNTI